MEFKKYKVCLNFTENVEANNEDQAKKLAFNNVRKYIFNGDEENIIISEINEEK